MKNFNHVLHLLFCLVITFSVSNLTFAQGNRIRGSQKAEVTQFIADDVQLTINFSRPGVKGREIWGAMVPFGMAPGNNYSDNKPFPWRAGANENTTIEINKDVKVEGKTLLAGKYSIHMIPSKGDWTVIINIANDQWGSYKYNQTQDVLRVSVTPEEAPFQEWLIFGFEDITENSATAYLHWEKLKIPFKIEL